MAQSLSSLLEITIDFDQSHLYFPRIVMVLLAVLLLWIVVSNVGRIRAALSGEGTRFQFFEPHADKLRLVATLALIPLYFVAMDYIDQLIPNMGMGFLLASIPFMFLLSFVYLHQRTPKLIMLIGANAIIAPLFVWFLLGQMFNISLP
ncbi:tripartite tricarboxylate transporter TctB family protein [Neptunomonas phycophila]|uniref:tripartite tricarboxylate transporter TctB family protein n=1 Tax=Neptunomonas phycophila TaxID=1572645 RepID=UPI001BE74AF4|nr:tripartite tricarboxylate transporter TctB family protein [Neptunomonas phycophila]MBT3145478.1 tripartite tricarboxylate transporter TctB family protein [Neptunomonas phycophila]